MKLLMFDADYIRYKPTKKGWASAPDVPLEEIEIDRVILCLIHVEAEDMDREKKVINKLLKNIKWLAGKLDKKRVVLHSFAHLSESKAEPEFVKALLDKVEERLKNVGYEVWQTPFGWFLDFESKWKGHSLGRIYKEL